MSEFLGVILVVGACTWCGFSMAAVYSQQERQLCELQILLNRMACELNYRATPLPELCLGLSGDFSGPVGQAIGRLGQALAAGSGGSVAGLMAASFPEELCRDCREVLIKLAGSLGSYDLEGQNQSLDLVQRDCGERLDRLRQEKGGHQRCYRALGLCGGAALAILLL